MPYPSMTLEFPGTHDFVIHFGQDGMNTNSAPSWAQLKHTSCPADKCHEPINEYCRLGTEIELLIEHFAAIKSIDKGKITFQQSNNMDICINSDAQHIFYHATWFILLHSNCFVFKHNQWLRKHYLPPAEHDEMFYTLFSSFVMEELFMSPNTPLDIKKFKAEIELFRGVLSTLLTRIKNGLEMQGDSVFNGLIILNNLIELLGIDFEKIYFELEEKIKNGSLLAAQG